MGRSAAAEEDGPAISFVIPARNEEALLPAALASVAAQHWALPRLEAVVVDNASTDGTAAAVRRFMDAGTELTVRLVAEPTVGRSCAKNTGAHAARGRILVFLDADSRAHPALAAAVWAADQAGHPAGAIPVRTDSARLVDQAFFRLVEWGKTRFGIRAQLFYCRRDLFLALGGFRPELQLAEDQEFLDRLRRSGHPVGYLDGAWITTSARRLQRLPGVLGPLAVLGRWTLAHIGIGRTWRY